MHQPMRAVLGIGATALLLIGPPVLLARHGWPLSEDLTWDYVRLSLLSLTLPPTVGYTLVLIALWVLWGLFTVLVAVDTVALFRGHLPRIALLRLVLTGAVGTSAAVSTPAAAAVAAADPELTEGRQEADTAQSPQVLERTRILSGFGFDAAQLTPEMAEELTPTVELLQLFGDPNEPVVVTGHADTVGDPEYNKSLSHHRAEEVATHLAEHLGEGWDITAAGVGSEQPRNHPELGPSADRRAEISYTLSTKQQPEPEAPADSDHAETDHDLTADQQDSGFPGGALLAGAVAGGAAGMVAGRLTAPGRRHRKAPPENEHEADELADAGAPEPEAGTPLAVTRDSDGPLVTPDGHVRIADTLSVNARDGLGITGKHAVGVCASIIGRALAEPDVRVITTRNLLTRAGAPERPRAEGLTQCADTASAITEAELAYIAGARPDTPNCALLLVEAPANALVSDRLASLATNQDSSTLVVVLDEEEAFSSVGCESFDRTEIIAADGTRSIYEDLRLLHIDQDTFAAYFGPAEEKPPPPDEPGSRESVAEPARPPIPEPTPAAEDPNKISVQLFAPRPKITYEGTDIGSAMRSSARRVIAYLALHPEGVGTEALTDALFPEVTERQARQLRNTACSSARGTVREALDDAEAEIIDVRSGRYQLAMDVVDVDVWRFDSALGAVAATKEEGERHRALRSAAVEYRAVLLTEADFPWIEEKRQYYRRRAADCFVSLAKATDDQEEAIIWLERARRSDDLNEAVYLELMKAHAAMGRSDAVQRTYQELCDQLQTMRARPSESAKKLLNSLIAP